MKTVFVSAFAENLAGFIDQKRALGYSYSNISDPKMFDRMCFEQFPYENNLTADICNAWAVKRGKETVKTTTHWSAFIREFARYLLRNGENAYILPFGTVGQGQRYIPHIYSHKELAEMWQMFDAYQPTEAYPIAHLVLPTLIRLLYCCGMRPSEALKLKVSDIDLLSGKLFIAESKANRDRIIVLADDVLELCRSFNDRTQEYFPIRNYFFAKNAVDICSYRWVSWVFGKIRDNLIIKDINGKPPRLYDLRHTFATHRLYQWMHENKDIYAMLPYLSAYMGHTKLTHTLYYVHLVPGMLEKMSGFSYGSVDDLFPEVVDAYE